MGIFYLLIYLFIYLLLKSMPSIPIGFAGPKIPLFLHCLSSGGVCITQDALVLPITSAACSGAQVAIYGSEEGM